MFFNEIQFIHYFDINNNLIYSNHTKANII
jgi:hypothetical protein